MTAHDSTDAPSLKVRRNQACRWRRISGYIEQHRAEHDREPTYQQIADATGIPLSTVAGDFYRVFGKARRCAEGESKA